LVGPRAAKSLIDFSKEEGQLKVSGAFTKIDVSKGSASSIHLFVNRRPISNSMLLSAIADGYGTRLMRGRYPIGYLMLDIPPNEIDINVHPTKREIKFSNPEMVRKSVLQAIEEAFSGLDSTPQLGDIMDYVRIGKATEKLEQGIPRHDFQARIETVDAVSESAPPLTPLFQLFDTYIVARGLVDDSIVVIDQHAAAERITYERILESLGQGDRRFQQLISPSILELTASEKVALEENKEHLRNIGFEIEEFGGGSYRLTSVPIVLGVEQGEASLKAVLDDVSKAGRRRPLGEELIWKVACHGSIRAGEDLSRQQMLALIVDLFKTKNPYNCEHGRPTMISLGISDLERLFKRQI
ncbi:MAG: hypothetical protein OEV21_06435, partial [Thermoplasmata archaeon]|nr:hypothetical protein [Thermoplasmata archaeon]